MYKLKPCPFCGGDAIFFQKAYAVSNSTRGWVFTVRCKKCGVALPKTNYVIEVNLGDSGEIKIATDERQQAAEAWNRRVNDV